MRLNPALRDFADPTPPFFGKCMIPDSFWLELVQVAEKRQL